MPRYRVELETSTLHGQPDESFAATVEAEDPEIAIALVKVMALRNGCRGRVVMALCQRVEEPAPEATPEPLDEEADSLVRVVEPEIGAPSPLPEFKHLTPGFRDTIQAIANALPERSATRLALELALATDRAQKTPTPKAHDFGRFGSADYCRRKDCQAKNQPPVNRWGCKGAA